MLYLGLDSGTQSTKALILDLESGTVLATASAPVQLIAGLPPGHLEQRPQDWLDAAEATISACLQQIGPRKAEIRGIGVSGQQHGLVVLDKKNAVLRPAKLWCDTSTTAQCAEFVEEFGSQQEIIRLAGNAMLPGYTAPKILWLKQNEPAHFEQVAAILLPHDYLNFWLTGEKTMEYGDASGTALLDVRTRKWSERLLKFIDEDLAEKLPVPQSSKLPAGLLRENLRTKWGLPANVVVSSGGGDNMLGAIGTGNVRHGVVTASLGTSGTLFACAPKPVIDLAAGEVAAFCDSADGWLPLVCTMNVTVATEQARALFQMDHEAFNQAVAQSVPGAGGLVFLPYLNGERTPNLPDGSGVFHGLNTRNMTPPNLARASMEGATLGLAYGLQKLRDLDVRPTEIRLTGGGSKSAAWRQIAADIFGVPVVCPSSAEGAALGAAMQAAWVEGLTSGHGHSLEEICQLAVQLDASTRCQPNAAHAELYAELAARQQGLTERLHGAGYL